MREAPEDGAAQELIIDRVIPGAIIGMGPERGQRLQIIMAAAMAEREIEDAALALGAFVKDGHLGLVPVGLAELGGLAFEAGVEEDVQITTVAEQEQLVFDAEIPQAFGERVVFGDMDFEGGDGGMGLELAADEGCEVRGFIGAIDFAIWSGAEDGVAAVEGEPAAAFIEEGFEGFGLGWCGDEIAGVSDEQGFGGEGFEAGVIAGDGRADDGVFGQQLEQFEAGEINIVKTAGGDEMDVQFLSLADFGARVAADMTLARQVTL